MRRILCMAVVIILILSTSVPIAMAAQHGRRNPGRNQPCGRETACPQAAVCSQDGKCMPVCTYEDADENGICDICSNVCDSCEGTDEDANGICDQCETCSHFQDADEDGICDRHTQRGDEKTDKICKTEKTQSRQRKGHIRHK